MKQKTDEKAFQKSGTGERTTGVIVRFGSKRELDATSTANKPGSTPANHDVYRPTWDDDDPGPTAA